MVKKSSKNFIVQENQHLGELYSLLKLAPADGVLPDIEPGQFVNVEVPNSKTTFLRRPISVNFVDRENGLLWLLVRKAGNGTSSLISSNSGQTLNIVLPLGKGFSVGEGKHLLVGGGVGVAPLLYLGKCLKSIGADVTFLLGAKSEGDLLEQEEFAKYGKICLSTEDGSVGEKGFVTTNSILNKEKFDIIHCCGPQPMMKAVAAIARQKETRCEVSLENVMACGIGACLCCVEDTIDGNVCVCKEGPVFDIDRLKW